VDAANAGRDSASVEVTATLGDLALGKVAASVGSANWGQTFEITKGGELAPLPGRLKPGRYPLKIVAKVGGQTVDTIEIQVDVGPSQVQNVRLDTKDKDTWLSWDKVPEDGCDYDIFVSPAGGPGVKRSAQSQLQWRVDPELLQLKESRWLYVVARHVESGLSGPPSAWVPLRNSDPFVGSWVGKSTLKDAPKVPPINDYATISHSGDRWSINRGDFLYASDDGETKFKVEGNRLTAERITDVDGRKTTFRWTAQLAGDSLTGQESCEEQGRTLWVKEFTLERK
jgi:hypothetical protein